MKRAILIFALALIIGAVGYLSAQMYQTHQPGSTQWSTQDKSKAPASIWWVNSATGTDSTAYGRSPSLPYATIDYALSGATTNDVIYVMPGHSEEISGTTTDFDIAGVSIIGLGTGTLRPRYDYNDTAATIDITAANVTVKNLTFRPSVSATVSGLTLNADADNAVIEDCEFMIGEASGTDEFISAITVTGASDVVIRHNVFRTAITDAQCTNAINLGVTTAVARTQIVDNLIYGNYSTAAIIDGGTACTELLIKDNVIKVKDDEPAIELEAATTAQIVGNMFECTGTNSALTIVGADSAWFQNYAVTADGTVGELVGSSI